MPDETPTSPEALLQRMIAFNTINARPAGVPGAEADLAEYVGTVAAGAGLSTRRLPVPDEPSNLLVSHRAIPDAPWLLFVSHLDTVDVAGMTIDPFAGEIRDGRIYGRGACDTKGSGAAMLWALMQYAARPDRPNNVAILYSVSEEFGKAGVISFVANDLPNLGWMPTGVIVGEPTETQPVVAHNGVCRWRICTQGASAHSSEPTHGRSAISMMVEVVRAIESRYIPHLTASHPLTGRAQCSINLIQGGSQINIIPDHCEIHVDRRLVPGEDPAEVLPAVEGVLDDVRRSDPSLRVEQDTPYIDPALDPATNQTWAGHVCRVIDGLGLSAAPCGAKFGAEASNFGQIGIAAIVLGPGSIAQAHSSDEWLALEQLRLAGDVYAGIMNEPAEGLR